MWHNNSCAQCSILAFEDLLDEPHNKRLMKLLYRTAEWHGFAKLKIHTDCMLQHLETLTRHFGNVMREFHDLTCSKFQTVELPREDIFMSESAHRNQHRHPSPQATLIHPLPHLLGER